MYPYWEWGGPWHMWGFGWIFPLIMMALMIGVFVFLTGGVHRRHGSHSDGALQILSERFARGEISKEEFEEKRAILGRRT